MTFIPTAAIETKPDGTYTVWTDWSTDDPGVVIDRPRTGGISTGRRRDYAERIAAAIDAGVAHTLPQFEPMQLATDNYGKTYVAAYFRISGRYIKSDLEALGF